MAVQGDKTTIIRYDPTKASVNSQYMSQLHKDYEVKKEYLPVIHGAHQWVN